MYWNFVSPIQTVSEKLKEMQKVLQPSLLSPTWPSQLWYTIACSELCNHFHFPYSPIIRFARNWNLFNPWTHTRKMQASSQGSDDGLISCFTMGRLHIETPFQHEEDWHASRKWRERAEERWWGENYIFKCFQLFTLWELFTIYIKIVIKI